MRYAIVDQQGQVVKVLDHSERPIQTLPRGHAAVPCSGTVGVGYGYDGDTFYALSRTNNDEQSNLYTALYPVLISLVGISFLALMIGLGMCLYQLLSGDPTPWTPWCVYGFIGTWLFPGIMIGLGVYSARGGFSFE